MSKRGGSRPGAGRPRGSKEPQTLAKEAARELLRAALTKQLPDIVDALVSRAKGVRYFVTRTDKGKFEIVTDPEQVVKALNKEDGYTGEFYTDKPDVPALKEVLDRMVDKSQEPPAAVEHSGGLTIRWQSDDDKPQK